MLPIPTRSGTWAFAGCVLVLLCGLLARSSVVTALSGGCFVGLALALAWTMPIGARLRRERLEFAWWHAQVAATESGVVVGAPFEIRCYVRNRSRRNLALRDLAPVMPQGIERLWPTAGALEAPPHTRTEFGFRLCARAPARVVLQGLSVTVPGPFGFFVAPLYFPSPLSVTVLPRAAARATQANHLGAESLDHVGLSLLRRPGAGTDLHELRELRPGDPFKSIAWKASARTGRLMVREVEREVQEVLYLVLDVSGSMRGGAPGERKLDHGIEMVATAARAGLERGEQVGVLTVDGRIVSRVEPGEGLSHMLRIYRALLAATAVVDADLTESDDDEVISLVRRYLRQQEGAALGANMRELVAYAERALLAEPDDAPVRAPSRESATLRRFCRLRGIPLTYRADTRGFAKAEGLALALREAVGTSRTPRSVIVLSDFDGVFDPSPLVRTLSLLRAQRHALSAIYFDARGLSLLAPGEAAAGERSPQRAALERDLRRVYGLHEARRWDEVRALLGRLGIPLVCYEGQRDKLEVVRRAQALRRVA